MEFQTVLFAFGLTLFAGLATGIGSILAFFTHRTNTRFLSLALGFSAGVMLYVSFVEILVKARQHGMKTKEVPVSVVYQAKGERVSHFRSSAET